MEQYQYVTPTVQTDDPRMRRAIDGWLGLYEACYVMKKLWDESANKAAEPDAPYGLNSAERPEPRHLMQALVNGCAALNDWNGAWAVGGGLAMNFHGHERATRDVDFFLLEKPDNLQPVTSALARHNLMPHTLEGPSFMPPDALFWWVPLQFGLPDSRPVDVDLLVAEHEFMAFIHATGIEQRVNDTRVRVIGAEALIVLKLQAFRGKDQTDVQMLLKANKNLDRALLNAWVQKFKLEARLEEMERQAQQYGGRRFG